MASSARGEPNRRGRLRIGTSGYQYPHWKGRFYPADLPKRAWFAYYADRFDTVEINATFYHLPSTDTVDRWREEAPTTFEYALKFSRYGSHIKRLKDPGQSLPPFLDLAARLEGHLGPVLVQLPPKWKPRPDRLDAFLAEAPSRHRWVVEVRDPSWFNEEVFGVLREHGAALCIHDMLDNHPRELTTDWTYLRYHGDRHDGGYTHQFLTAESDRVADLLKDGHDVHAYFNNDESAHAVHDALALKRYVEDRL